MRTYPKHDVAVEVRLAGNQITDHVVAHDLLVYRVGLNMFAVERNARRRRVEALQGLDHPSGARRRRDFRRGEMSDRGAAQPAVQTEQRHQVHHSQRLGGNSLEVTQIRRVQFRRGQQIGEELLVQPGTLAGAVFVELDRHEGRLGSARSGAESAQACGSPSLR